MLRIEAIYQGLEHTIKIPNISRTHFETWDATFRLMYTTRALPAPWLKESSTDRCIWINFWCIEYIPIIKGFTLSNSHISFKRNLTTIKGIFLFVSLMPRWISNFIAATTSEIYHSVISSSVCNTVYPSYKSDDMSGDMTCTKSHSQYLNVTSFTLM